MNEIRIFDNEEFGEIRTVVIDGEPWFVAKDISEKLGYAKTFNMTKQIDDEDKMIFDSSSQEDTNFSVKTRKIGLINESGLYTAIMGSTLKSAKKFKRWVTSDVLPSIRKTGSYQQPQQPQFPQTTAGQIQLLAQGHMELKEEVDGIKADLQALKLDLPILPLEAEKITDTVKHKAVDLLGGKQSNAYNDRSVRAKVFNSIYSNLKYNFSVSTYRAIKRSQVDKATEIIQKYELPYFLSEQIAGINSQQRLEI
jgi:prophage antirepressor-like protein